METEVREIAFTFEQSPAIDALAKALAQAQGRIHGAKKDSENPFFKSKYSDLESVWSVCREPLSQADLSIVQAPGADERGVFVITQLNHGSGQWMRSRLDMVPKDMSPQAVGSVISYCRRYALSAMVGVYSADDDAEAGQDHEDKTAKSWDGTQIVGFSKNYRDSMWKDVPLDFLTWITDGKNRVHQGYRDDARKELARREATAVVKNPELDKSFDEKLPETFYATQKAS